MPWRLVGAFVAAFGAQEGLLFAFAHVAGGLETFTPRIVMQIVTNNGLWLVALVVVRRLLTSVAPIRSGLRPSPRLA